MTKNKNVKEGGISIALLLLVLAIPILLASYATLSANSQQLSQRAIYHLEAKIIVENALSLGAESFYFQLKLDPTIQMATLENTLNKNSLVRFIQNQSATSLKRNTEGFMLDAIHFSTERIGRTNLVTIVASAQHPTSGIKVGVTSTYQVIEQSFLANAIYSDGIFELAPWPQMHIYGDVRSNDRVRIGARAGLNFHGKIWASGLVDVVPSWGKNAEYVATRIYADSVNGVAKNFFPADGTGRPLDSEHPNWETDSRTRWGEGQIQAQMPALEVPFDADDNRALIEPPDTVNDNEVLKREKMAWKAKTPGGLFITIDHHGDISFEQNGGGTIEAALAKIDIAEPQEKDTDTGVYKIKKNKVGGKNYRGWIDVDDTFEDSRETSKGVRIVNIYMDQLIKRFPSTRIVYVEVQDEDGNLTPFLEAKADTPSLKLPAVRIRNGNDISAALEGITITTHRMAYLEGNYNKENTISSLIAADNLTVLSNGWSDDNKATKRPRASPETWYQAAFMTGGYTYQEDQASPNIEGFQNYIRYREDWGSGVRRIYHYRGAYVKLFNSKETTAAARSDHFRAPDRIITYNSDFIEQPPPGMPTALSTPEVVIWKEISWDEAQALIP